MSILSDVFNLVTKPIKGCIWLVIMLILAAIFVCVALGALLVSRVSAAPPDGASVMLLIDQSPSMWDRDGVGSDPGLLRISAADLFLTYLGADDPEARHRVGVINFGGESHLIVPLTQLNADARDQIQSAIANPTPIPWTDPLEALTLARQELESQPTSHRQQAIILLTDGEPVIPDETPEALDEYRKQLSETIGALSQQGISLYVVLLENPAADNQKVETIWAPFWTELAGDTPRGAFFLARQAQDLMDIYHEIVVGITGGNIGEAFATRPVTDYEVMTFTVPPGLASMTITVWKNTPDIAILLYQPDGQQVNHGDANLRYAGKPGKSHEEVWRIENPVPGRWQLEAQGNGLVTLWMDVIPGTPTPTPTSTVTPIPTATPHPTATIPPTSTATKVAVAPAPVATITPISSSIPISSSFTPPEPVLQKPDSLTTGLLITMGILLIVFSGVVFTIKPFFNISETPLEGKLLVLRAPAKANLPQVIDLSMLKKTKVLLASNGVDSADYTLPDWDGSLVFQAYQEAGEVYITVTVKDGSARINSYPTREKVLNDGDEIEVEGYRFRFSHLASARRAWKQRRVHAV